MRLNKFLLRYAPPGNKKNSNHSTIYHKFAGLGLDYTQGGVKKVKVIDLHHITRRYCKSLINTQILTKNIYLSTKVEELAQKIADEEALITSEARAELLVALTKIQNTIFSLSRKLFYKNIVLETHLLPLTNIAVAKDGEMYLIIVFFMY